jgi:hypothetical protein
MVAVRRTHAGRHAESGHHWPHDGAVLEVEDGLASRLLAEPPVTMYTAVEPGETTEVDEDDEGVCVDREDNLGTRHRSHRVEPGKGERVEGRGGGRGPDRP